MLSALMEQELQEEFQEQEKESFKINDLEGSTWAFRKIRAYQEKIKEAKAVAEKERAIIDEWLSSETKSLESSIEFFNGLLIDYYQRQKEVDPKFKLSTPYGIVSSRKNPDKLEYDEEKFLAYAEENNMDLLRFKTEINKDKAKELLTVNSNGIIVDSTTGEILNCVRLVEGETKITVKIKEDK